jgi:hypothetical protein
MSQENVESIRRMIEAANASGWDPESVEDWVHPEARIYPASDFPGPDLYVGREDVAAFIREWTSTFDDLRWELDQLIDLGDRVLVLARMIGRSRTTVTAVDWPFGGLFSDSGAACLLRFATSWTAKQPSKPPACRSETLTSPPEPAGCPFRMPPRRQRLGALPLGLARKRWAEGTAAPGPNKPGAEHVAPGCQGQTIRTS